MKKEKLSNFISKYYLAGNADSVKLIVKDKVLSTKFITADQTVIGEVELNEFDAEDVEFGVYTTGQLIKLISALDDSVNLTFNKVESKVYSVTMDDTITKASYMLSDLSVIPTAPNLKQLPPFDVKIELTKEFTSKFIKAKNALPEADNFAVESDGTNTNIIINYSNVNTNKISFKATTLETSSMSPVCFSAKLFKEILEANKDCTGTLEISSKGLGRVTFSNKEFSTVYYLVKLSIN
jgi:hypothetical protein